MALLESHAMTLHVSTDATHTVLCDCGWMSGAWVDPEDSSDEVVDHLFAVFMMSGQPRPAG